MFPPVPAEVIDAGYEDFAERWNPILDVFDDEGVRFAHEVHPSEIAYDHWTTVRALEAIDHRQAFALNWDPSHRSEEHTSELQSRFELVCRLLLEKKNQQ